MNEAKTIFFIGKPGSGKTTQAKLLIEKTGLLLFISGNLFREIAREDTPLGRKVKNDLNVGMLQPHWFAEYLYLKSFFSIPDKQGAVFDGAGRTVPEAELIVESLDWMSRPFFIVNIKASDDEVEQRLTKRREIEGRVDDHNVDKRLKEYYEHTEQAIEIFRATGKFAEIDGEQEFEKVFFDICTTLGIT